jgi:DNA invertase Pin-like site-specific DNA recombinase
MFIGYARVSPPDETLQLQKDALTKAGSKGLAQALSHLRAGDTLVVWRFDRLGSSIKEVIVTMTELSERGIEFQSLTEQIDTTARGGKQFFRIFDALRTLLRQSRNSILIRTIRFRRFAGN